MSPLHHRLDGLPDGQLMDTYHHPTVESQHWAIGWGLGNVL